MKALMMLMAGGLSCKDVDERLDAFVDHDMPLVQRARMHMHLGVCKACAAYLTAYRKTVELVKGSLENLDGPDDVPGTDEAVNESLIESILSAQDLAKPEN